MAAVAQVSRSSLPARGLCLQSGMTTAQHPCLNALWKPPQALQKPQEGQWSTGALIQGMPWWGCVAGVMGCTPRASGAGRGAHVEEAQRPEAGHSCQGVAHPVALVLAGRSQPFRDCDEPAQGAATLHASTCSSHARDQPLWDCDEPAQDAAMAHAHTRSSHAVVCIDCHQKHKMEEDLFSALATPSLASRLLTVCTRPTEVPCGAMC